VTVVKLSAGALLAAGRLTRPVTLFLTMTFTYFSVTLGENPLFHANRYGVMVILILSGCEIPQLRGPSRGIVDGEAVPGEARRMWTGVRPPTKEFFAWIDQVHDLVRRLNSAKMDIQRKSGSLTAEIVLSEIF
jgi:hypothetical protein